MKTLCAGMAALFMLGCAITPTGHQKLSQGYPFGSTHDFVLAALEADQFEPFDVSEDELWYYDLISGHYVSVAIFFDPDQRYSGAMWNVWDTSAAAFEAVNDALANYYGVDFIDESADGTTKFVLYRDGTGILHVRDPSEDLHSVYYYPLESDPYTNLVE